MSSTLTFYPDTPESSFNTSPAPNPILQYVDNDDLNILVTGSKCTGKSSLCETLVLLLANEEDTFHFEYIDVNHYRNQYNKLSLPLNRRLKSMIRAKLDNGFILIEDTSFEFYNKKSFSAIFILKTDDEVLEQRLISQGDFHTPYNDFHIMEPYNSVCESFPYTKRNKIFILNNTLDRHLNLNARFIKKWIDENKTPPEKFQPKFLDSDGYSYKTDSDDSDADETLIHTDGKFKKSSYFRFNAERWEARRTARRAARHNLISVLATSE